MQDNKNLTLCFSYLCGCLGHYELTGIWHHSGGSHPNQTEGNKA